MEKKPADILISASDYIFEGNYGAAEKILLECVEKYPENHLARYNLGVLYLESGNPQKALDFLVEAEKLDGKDCDTVIEAALALQQTGNIEKAKEYYARALSLDPSPFQQAVICNNTGSLLFGEGKFREAKKYFLMALEKEENYETARQNLLLANTDIDITG